MTHSEPKVTITKKWSIPGGCISVVEGESTAYVYTSDQHVDADGLNVMIDALQSAREMVSAELTADDIIRRYLLGDDEFNPAGVLALAPSWEASGEPSFFKWLVERVASLKDGRNDD